MNEQQAKELIEKYINGESSAQEQALLESWYLKQATAFDPPDAKTILANEKLMWAFLESRIAPRKVIRLWPRIAAAAAVLLVLFSAGLFYVNRTVSSNADSVVMTKDIGPGKVGATLTLASGKRIRLADVASGQIASESGMVVVKKADGRLEYQVIGAANNPKQLNTLSTSKGETYSVVLPDGSKVWMNAASSLTYSASLLSTGKRSVLLSGEAYFEVAKDKAHPFVVTSAAQEVEVLGTHFNVNAYGDETQVRTTLLEGSIKVAITGSSSMAVLKPDQQAVVSSGSLIKVEDVIAEASVDWKEGTFNFKKEELPSIMRKVARWYDVEVVYQGIEVQGQTYSGYVSRSENVSKVLKILAKISGLKFKVEGKKIIVTK